MMARLVELAVTDLGTIERMSMVLGDRRHRADR